jgi:putative endonuclease
MFFVYILQCSDGSYYTGHTDNLEKRINEHSLGLITNCYTYNRRPIKLLFSQEFYTREEALSSERQIKGWSRKKKEALIDNDWEKLKELSKKKK